MTNMVEGHASKSKAKIFHKERKLETTLLKKI